MPSTSTAVGGAGTTGSNTASTGSSTMAGFTTTGTGTATCLDVGAACAGKEDCCSGSCVGGVCEFAACTADNQACTAPADCCGGSCTDGKCSPLNAQCLTLGNPCSDGGNPGCCSGLCSKGVCSASSFCVQDGDVCTTSGQCCGGSCTIAADALYGTCASAPSGAANCSLTDGMICDGGVVYSGGPLPTCGGSCCSRSCLPYGPTGVLVCQPASGCHVVGDLCAKDTDCCGAAGLPGGSGKPVTCEITPPYTTGVCRNPMGCKPDGDVCKLATESCNASCDCCSGNCENKDTCKLDNVGVPRCAAATCVASGGSCASSANCCDGAPCVPNPNGSTPPYVCFGGGACVPSCGTCTVNADCCAGETCDVANGTTIGVCGPCNSSSSTTATTGTGSSTGSSSSTGGGTSALYGQSCKDLPCCDGVTCLGPTDVTCSPSDPACTCKVIPS